MSFGENFLTIEENKPHQTKLIYGEYKFPVTITKKADRLWFQFGFNRGLMAEVKMMAGAKWHGFEDVPIKQWSVNDSTRNRFRIAFMEGRNPYAWYDRPLTELHTTRQSYSHQDDLFRSGYTYHYNIWASETGTGKTLAAIELIEAANAVHCFYVAPKSALNATRLEFEKWKCKYTPVFITYEGLRDIIENWQSGTKPPKLVIFDEASRLKNPTAKRTIAAKHLADSIRDEWGWDGYVILMSGTPAPKSPVDWWSLCEITMPGFIREGNAENARRRLAIMSEGQSDSGQVFKKLVTWCDDEKKCVTCGKIEADPEHDNINMTESWFHGFKKSVNEVGLLYERMKGLVEVKLKKNCFGGDTRLLTRYGPKKISELAQVGHAELYVMTDNGMTWIDCPVKSFGQDRTYDLVFGDHHRVRTTLNHQWLYREKGIIKERKLSTMDLKIGKTELPLAPIVLSPPEDKGYAHGFVYGDGYVKNGNSAAVPLYGSDSDLKPLLFQFGNLGYLKRRGWDSYIDTIESLPQQWKELPVEPSKEYALGFILGLVAADGCSAGSLRIYQADESEIYKIADLAIYAGLRIGPIRMAREFSPFDGSRKPLYYFVIQTYNLKSEWIIRNDHRSKMVVRKKLHATTVFDIDYQSGKTEEVFCATVPTYHNFTLANGVITGNCLSLPDKQYKIIRCKPNQSIINAAKLLMARGESTVKTLTLLRELSDGFQYEKLESGTEKCPLCKGVKTIDDWVYIGPDDQYEKIVEDQLHGRDIPGGYFEKVTVACVYCSGVGEVTHFVQEAIQVPCPKEDELADIIDQHDDVGRLICYAGFTGSIDRCVQCFTKQQWEVIRVDGRGWWSPIVGDAKTLLRKFMYDMTNHPRLAFIGQPGAAGMGLNLTCSPTVVFYSNDFNAESRSQAEDRIHRIGMDNNRGATIIDIFHLPTDEKVLDNLKKKKRLQDLSMGEFESALQNVETIQR